MKVKQAKTVELSANEELTINLNKDTKAGDTVARELVLYFEGNCSLENESGDQSVIFCSNLQVDTYAGGGWAIVPCEGIDALVFTALDAGTLTYQILV